MYFPYDTYITPSVGGVKGLAEKAPTFISLSTKIYYPTLTTLHTHTQ